MALLWSSGSSHTTSNAALTVSPSDLAMRGHLRLQSLPMLWFVQRAPGPASCVCGRCCCIWTIIGVPAGRYCNHCRFTSSLRVLISYDTRCAVHGLCTSFSKVTPHSASFSCLPACMAPYVTTSTLAALLIIPTHSGTGLLPSEMVFTSG